MALLMLNHLEASNAVAYFSFCAPFLSFFLFAKVYRFVLLSLSPFFSEGVNVGIPLTC